MEIIYLGHSCFKLKGKEKSVICDPFDPRMLNIRLPKQECDIVTISHEHQDHNFLDNVACLRVVRDPGEYVTKIGAKRVIPMHYKALGISDMFSKLSDLSDFFKLTGLKVENLAKLSIKANEENGDEQIIYALEKK
ncbi:MBL fold metallo-hydrolase [Candidatus Woesebacteria bacterium]|nr:MBL fold metallo-hydrolase [Candidatus Woesebacteria bacterium]